ncbi:hypothetical protein PT974_05305 [Cladobotryum mycophilum]|uniref:HTH psq-type domain-containing protein n=1 Tax=Cladobotryum mycophilum TaxID=491253 RepID=A0ABR0SID4_9HYPO
MPPLQTYDIGTAPPKKKRGPKPKPLSERGYKPKGPVKRIERSYRAGKKDEVIMYLLHHKVPSTVFMGHPRRPSLREAAHHFKIPKSTICGWLKKDSIKLGERDEVPGSEQVNQPADQPVDQSVNPPADSSSTPPLNNTAAASVTGTINEPTNEPINEVINEQSSSTSDQPSGTSTTS